MRTALLLTFLGIASLSVAGQNADERPRITGFDHVTFYTTAPDGVAHLYHDVLGLAAATPLEAGDTLQYTVGKQWVGFCPAPDRKSPNRLDHVAFATDDLAALQRYLAAKGVAAPDPVQSWPDGSRSFRVKDPEGHLIEFVERAKNAVKPDDSPISHRLIHAGFIVRNRAAEDAFYRDILGFHVYWHGGMRPGRTDWCAMQVPDGTDWLEYMLNVTAQPHLHTMGEMNHISLGVVDMKQAQAKLESHGWRPHGDEQAEIGKDGKWQLDLFDPDFSRVELMEFLPKQKPCCSDFQGKQPGPDD